MLTRLREGKRVRERERWQIWYFSYILKNKDTYLSQPGKQSDNGWQILRRRKWLAKEHFRSVNDHVINSTHLRKFDWSARNEYTILRIRSPMNEREHGSMNILTLGKLFLTCAWGLGLLCYDIPTPPTTNYRSEMNMYWSILFFSLKH